MAFSRIVITTSKILQALITITSKILEVSEWKTVNLIPLIKDILVNKIKLVKINSISIPPCQTNFRQRIIAAKITLDKIQAPGLTMYLINQHLIVKEIMFNPS